MPRDPDPPHKRANELQVGERFRLKRESTNVFVVYVNDEESGVWYYNPEAPGEVDNVDEAHWVWPPAAPATITS